MEHPRGCLDLEAQSLFRGELAGVAHGATAEPDEFAAQVRKEWGSR